MNKMKNVLFAGGLLCLGALTYRAIKKPIGDPSPYKAMIFDETAERKMYYAEHPDEELSEKDKWLFQEFDRIEADHAKYRKKAFYKSLFFKHPLYAMQSLIDDIVEDRGE